MKHNWFFAFAILVAACSTTKETPPKQYTIAQFMDIVPINGGAFSADESKIVYNSRATGIFNAYEIDLKTGQEKQLTSSTTNAIFSQSYFPSDDRMLYTSDNGGNEINHLYVRNQDGSVIDLMQDSTAKAQFAGWSYNKKLMYYSSNSRDKKFFDSSAEKAPPLMGTISINCAMVYCLGGVSLVVEQAATKMAKAKNQ
ncbi:MAG: TolB family protein, partial [Flammeovirgaceae bacterium]